MHTADTIFVAFQRAVAIALRLPCAGPTGMSNPWPHILRLGHEGYCEKGKPSSALTAAEMEEFETTSSWIGFMKHENDRRMIWACAAGVPGWKVGKALQPPVSQSTISRRMLWALGFITWKLNHNEVPPPIRLRA